MTLHVQQVICGNPVKFGVIAYCSSSQCETTAFSKSTTYRNMIIDYCAAHIHKLVSRLNDEDIRTTV